jgi:hypothetical protein
MYLSLFGQPWGNSPQTVAMLGNTKTLSITTQFDLAGENRPQPIIKMMMHPDGRIDDTGALVSELIPAG